MRTQLIPNAQALAHHDSAKISFLWVFADTENLSLKNTHRNNDLDLEVNTNK